MKCLQARQTSMTPIDVEDEDEAAEEDGGEDEEVMLNYIYDACMTVSRYV